MMPLAGWGPAEASNRPVGSVHYSNILGADGDSVQIQWNRNYTPGYITSIASGLSKLGSGNELSEGSATESQSNLQKPSCSTKSASENEKDTPM